MCFADGVLSFLDLSSFVREVTRKIIGHIFEMRLFVLHEQSGAAAAARLGGETCDKSRSIGFFKEAQNNSSSAPRAKAA